MFQLRYINYRLIGFRLTWAKYGANKNKIRRDNKVSSFFIYYISWADAKKDLVMDTVIDENPILVNALGSDSFGFSCTRNSWMSGFGSGAAQGDFTRTLDLRMQRWRISMIGSQGYEDTLDIHACESFGYS